MVRRCQHLRRCQLNSEHRIICSLKPFYRWPLALGRPRATEVGQRLFFWNDLGSMGAPTLIHASAKLRLTCELTMTHRASTVSSGRRSTLDFARVPGDLVYRGSCRIFAKGFIGVPGFLFHPPRGWVLRSGSLGKNLLYQTQNGQRGIGGPVRAKHGGTTLLERRL